MGNKQSKEFFDEFNMQGEPIVDDREARRVAGLDWMMVLIDKHMAEVAWRQEVRQRQGLRW